MKEFIVKNEMTCAISRRLLRRTNRKDVCVNAIPHTFTIYADGVLQDEHIGDASIEGKLKKLSPRPATYSQPKSAK